jgi:ABC-type methionine transport system permease subunit
VWLKANTTIKVNDINTKNRGTNAVVWLKANTSHTTAFVPLFFVLISLTLIVVLALGHTTAFVPLFLSCCIFIFYFGIAVLLFTWTAFSVTPPLPVF